MAKVSRWMLIADECFVSINLLHLRSAINNDKLGQIFFLFKIDFGGDRRLTGEKICVLLRPRCLDYFVFTRIWILIKLA